MLCCAQVLEHHGISKEEAMKKMPQVCVCVGGGGVRVRVRACAACSICVWFEHEHPCVYSTYVNSYLCCASVNNQLCCIVACEEHPGSATGTNCVPYNLIVLLASDTDLQQFRLIYLNQPKRGLAKHAVHSYFR